MTIINTTNILLLVISDVLYVLRSSLMFLLISEHILFHILIEVTNKLLPTVDSGFSLSTSEDASGSDERKD